MRKTKKQDNPAAKMEGMLRRLHWTVLRPLATRLGGDEHSLLRGPGMEFEELREYQPGDDVRLIDWNVTAREGTPFVRQSFVERALDVWIMLDLSASVDWGTAQCLKRDRALEFIAVAGQIFDRSRHHVGALFFADHPLGFIPPSSGRTHMLRMLEALRSEPQQSRRGRTDLKAALGKMEIILNRRSLILLISDFLVKDGWQPTLGRLIHKHEIVAVRLSDPRESDLPDVGLITLEDPETGGQMIVNTGDARLRERFRQAAQQQSERIRRSLAGRGVDYLELNTAEDLLPVLIRFLENRRKQAQLLNRGHKAQQAARGG